jgi:tripartite ATP-independent transporter DctM subunit
MTLQFALCLLTLFFLAGIGTPVAYSIIVSSFVYLAVNGQGVGIAGKVLMDGLYQSFILLAVPLFIVAANIMNAGTISDRLLQFCVAAVGRFRGGLGHVNIVASLIFSGMSGSAVADAAGIGKIIIGMMTRSGHYSRGYAAAITAASATIGPVIPPSIPMVLYALVSNTSIGYLFLGGIVPGLFMGAVLMMMNTLISTRRNFTIEEPVPLRDLPRQTANAFPALLMPAILLYGIYGGVTTPTEAAAVAAAYALLLAGLFYRALSLRALYGILVDSARSSAAVGLVIGGALILNYVVASENIPNLVAQSLVGLDVSPLTFLIGVNILFLLLGCVLDATTIILVIIPLFLPACEELGIDLVHFGVVAVINCMIGLITPPYGILLFVINAVTQIPLREIISEIWAFLGVLLLALAALILFPGIVLWLPRMFGYPDENRHCHGLHRR